MFAVMELAGYTAPEADDLRKAVAKKIKEKLLKHRQKFINGAVERGISEETASAIFDEWEEFARYGFNKAHAADYGVIAVQTAYLKAHYPVEYMTALLTVSRNDTAKIALYVADCRRMGIRVEPPDINCSGWDFTIEGHQDGTSTIRFGLGAVKNVGRGPVDAILEGRSDKDFKDLNDFAHRVDLRQVGKRALESLIRVGALDSFGSRHALLDGIDRIISASSAHFRAAEMGQMSLFGAHTGVQETIALPTYASQISRRELLNWERELIGLYVSDHPLSPVMVELTEAVTHFSGQLAEAAANEHVRVAGMIVRIRPHVTKSGKSMGFVTIEDLQGAIELVIFPKTWERFTEVIVHDKIVLVDGRLDTQGAEPKVLVDNIRTDFTMTVSSEAQSEAAPLQNSIFDTYYEQVSEILEQQPEPGTGNILAGIGNGSLEQVYPDVESWMDDMPPPPDFPDEWDGLPSSPQAGTRPISQAIPVVTAQAADASLVRATASDIEPATAPLQQPESNLVPEPGLSSRQGLAAVESSKPPAILSPLGDTIASPDPVERLVSAQQYLVSPTAGSDTQEIHMITVVMRSTGDKTRDVLRMRRIHGTVMSYPGNDRFAFQVFEQGHGYLVEFPNFTTQLCPELISRLRLLVGMENVRVEAITFQ
jgi:DNA polymerase-3 subunit alpha